ncbi:hypothetical protein [Asticcacaulis taihuensis]|uniref:hypothetical protein n=1 Tax=Asticcacaulis taihuensis TaxID=260084 RepID=UPI003F7CB768
MSISGDYPHPVTVNGYSCRNCTDVDYARKHIDPAHPKSGPYGVNAKADPTVKTEAAFHFGGRLSGIEPSQGGASVPSISAAGPGAHLNILA